MSANQGVRIVGDGAPPLTPAQRRLKAELKEVIAQIAQLRRLAQNELCHLNITMTMDECAECQRGNRNHGRGAIARKIGTLRQEKRQIEQYLADELPAAA